MAGACVERCEEVPVQAPWSFGPIPPGSITAPSYAESVAIAVDWACDWLLAHPRTFLLGGYSQGAEAAARVHAELKPGGRLEALADLYVAAYTFGNPSRQLEHTFYLGPPRDGEGIAQFRQQGMGDDWADETDPDDMYAGVPANLTGEIMRDVYTLCIEMEMHSGFAEFARTLAANCLEVLQNLDGDAYDDVQQGMARHGLALEDAQLLPPATLQPVSNKLLSITGITATIAACIRGLMFVCTPPYPTAAHCEYHHRDVFPAQTYVAHAIQHVNDWAARVQPRQFT